MSDIVEDVRARRLRGSVEKVTSLEEDILKEI